MSGEATVRSGTARGEAEHPLPPNEWSLYRLSVISGGNISSFPEFLCFGGSLCPDQLLSNYAYHVRARDNRQDAPTVSSISDTFVALAGLTAGCMHYSCMSTGYSKVEAPWPCLPSSAAG